MSQYAVDPNPGEGELATLKRILASSGTGPGNTLPGTTEGTYAVGDDSRFVNIFTPEQFGGVGDGLVDGTGTDDTTALQDAINVAHANGGGVVRYSRPHRITASLVVPDGVSIEAASGGQRYGKVSTNSEAVNVPVIAPFTGPMLIQTTAATNAITITASGSSVNLRNVNICFADPIRFSNTGHGIYCLPPIMATDRRDSGIMGARWDHVSVYGHDGNHYAFWVVNPLNCHFSHLTSWGGGGLCIKTNGVLDVNHLLGNVVVEAAYCNLFLAGSAHAYYLKNTHGETILMTFIRPQSWVRDERPSGITTSVPVGGTPGDMLSGQHTFYVDPTANTGGTGASRWLTIIARDFESNIHGTGEIIPPSAGMCITPGLANGSWGNPYWTSVDTEGFVMGELSCKYGELTVSGISTLKGSNPVAGVLNLLAAVSQAAEVLTIRDSNAVVQASFDALGAYLGRKGGWRVEGDAAFPLGTGPGLEGGYTSTGVFAYLQAFDRTLHDFAVLKMIGKQVSLWGSTAQTGIDVDEHGTVALGGVLDIPLLTGVPPPPVSGKLRIYGGQDGKLHVREASGTDHALW